MKMKQYTLYATNRGYGFTTKSAKYSNGTHRWVYKIFAASIQQAWYVAIHELFAPDRSRAGIRKIQFAYWHYRSMPEPGDLTLAPYLLEQRRETETMEA